MSESRRRWRRFDVQIDGEVRSRSGRVATRTRNLCEGGALLALPGARVGGAVSIELDVPEGPFGALATVAHTDGLLAGVEFVVVPVAQRRAFDAWLHAWAAQHQPDRRSASRAVRDLVVWGSDDEGLHGYALRDVSATGMFLHTLRSFRVSEPVTMLVVEPSSERTLRIAGRVVRVVAEGPVETRGVGVEFEGMGPDEERLLAELLAT